MNKLVLGSLLILLVNTLQAAVPGCTDPLASNYNAAATVNDGSCVYASATVNVTTSSDLSSTLKETSGLIHWNNQLWSHNDDTDTHLYSLDTLTAAIVNSYLLPKVVNIDWEEISQDNNYVYVGDFGNNSNGNRSDLKVLRIDKNSLLQNTPQIDTIYFTYSNQTDFTPKGNNATDFDCEAFVVSTDSIYLFTKQWVSNQTSVYAMPKTAGTHVAQLKQTYNVQGLITGATYLESQKVLVLCGYSTFVQPFLYACYDFKAQNFFSANKRKLTVGLSFHQVEGIATANGLKYYISNENFSKSIINTTQKLHILDLAPYLGNYLHPIITATTVSNTVSSVQITTLNNETLQITTPQELLPLAYSISNSLGQTLDSGSIRQSQHVINLGSFPAGTYFLNTDNKITKPIKFIKTDL